MEPYIDLHVHSSCSDGTLTPREVVRYAAKKGLAAIALTDHDTIRGIAPAREEADKLGIMLIHILGLDIDVDNAYFAGSLSRFLDSRNVRNRKMIRLLSEHKIPITWEIMEQRFPEAVWTRAHFARYLLDEGYVSSMAEAFSRYIGDQACCFVPREKVTPFQAIRLIQ